MAHHDERRNKFICDLAVKTKGNTLILFQFVEKHGKVLKRNAQRLWKTCVLYSRRNRRSSEEARKVAETIDNGIILASYGTFSTGVNIKRLNNIVFITVKSRVRCYRVLEDNLESLFTKALHDSTTSVMTCREKYQNHTRHFIERKRFTTLRSLTISDLNTITGRTEWAKPLQDS